MSILDLDYNDNKNYRRRRSVTISLSITQILKSDVGIYYKEKKMCDVLSFDVVPYFDTIIRFKLKYKLYSKKQKLHDNLGEAQRPASGVKLHDSVSAVGGLSKKGMYGSVDYGMKFEDPVSNGVSWIKNYPMWFSLVLMVLPLLVYDMIY